MPQPLAAMHNRARQARAVAKAFVAMLLAVFVLGLVYFDPHSDAIHVFIDLGWTFFSVAAFATCVLVAQRTNEPGRRKAWWAFAAGSLTWSLGILQWSWLELVAGVVTPFPVLGDLGYLSTPVCFALGLLFYGSDAPGVKATLKQIGELGIVLATMGLTFGFVFGEALDAQDTSFLYRATALAYPVLHSTAVTFALTTLWSRTWHKRSVRVVAYVFASLLSLTVVNTYYAQTLLLATYEAGHLMDPGWCLAFAFIVIAGIEELGRDATHIEEERVRVTTGDILLPSVCITIVSITGTLQGFHASSTTPFLGVMGLLLALSLGVRNFAQTGIEIALRDDIRERERQFVEAQKMKAVATLAGGLAHDFNNLLTGVLGGVSMLRRNDNLDASDASYLDLVEQSAERAADLTRRLLVFAHRREPELAASNPWHILGRAATLVRSSAPANIVVREEGGPRDLSVHVDASQLEHALVNLGLNGMHAMPKGGRLHFVMSVERRAESGDLLVFEVRDTGVGIADEVRDRIFEPFYSTRAPGEGTGLGLAMVRSAATAHNGVVELRTEVNRGSTFRLVLPLIEASGPALASIGGNRGSMGHETVLVVDDRGAALLATQAILEAAGYRVLSCSRASEAMELLDADPNIDLLIVDLGLPDADGLELAARMRGRISSLPVILMTGQMIPQELPSFIARVLEKPYRARDLMAAVRDVLDQADVEVRDAV